MQGDTVLGRAVLSDGLKPQAGSTTLAMAGKIPIAVATEGGGGKLVLYAVDPEASENDGSVRPAVISNAFTNQLLKQAQWLVGAQPAPVFVGDDLPDDSPGGAVIQVKLAPHEKPIEVEAILRDDERVVYHRRQTLAPAADGRVLLPLPQAWMVQGPVRVELTVRAGPGCSHARRKNPLDKPGPYLADAERGSMGISRR